MACEHLSNPTIDLVVLDEFTYTLNYKWLSFEEVVGVIESRSAVQRRMR